MSSAGLTQLTLDDALDALQVTCPRCGYQFDVRQAEVAVRVAGLSPATRAVWDAAGHRFQRGSEWMGPSQLAARVNLSRSTAAYHVTVLLQAGLVRAVPQNKYKRQRHLYTGKV